MDILKDVNVVKVAILKWLKRKWEKLGNNKETIKYTNLETYKRLHKDDDCYEADSSFPSGLS